MTAADDQRAYGTDSYWQRRYAARAQGSGLGAAARAQGDETDETDETDEWLLGWEQLRPLIAPSLPSSARVLDIGCGTSSLALDLACDLEDARVLAIDVAPAALDAQRAEKRRRLQSGEQSAARCELACADAAQSGALDIRAPGWARVGEGSRAFAFDACVDKATTDGMLCDTRRNAGMARPTMLTPPSARGPSNTSPTPTPLQARSGCAGCTLRWAPCWRRARLWRS